MIDIELIKAQNLVITGHGDVISEHLLESAFSSYMYYEETTLQICSIYRGIIKNNPFRDGNKRTACAVLILLCKASNIKLSISPIELGNLTINIAENKYTVEAIEGLIFRVSVISCVSTHFPLRV